MKNLTIAISDVLYDLMTYGTTGVLIVILGILLKEMGFVVFTNR